MFYLDFIPKGLCFLDAVFFVGSQLIVGKLCYLFLLQKRGVKSHCFQ